MKEMTSDKLWSPMLTVREAARLLSVHTNTVRRWSNLGVIQTYRITPRGDRRFLRHDVLRLVASLNANSGKMS